MICPYCKNPNENTFYSPNKRQYTCADCYHKFTFKEGIMQTPSVKYKSLEQWLE